MTTRSGSFHTSSATANGAEMSVDLMRHVAALPYGVMDFLFIRLMQYARDRGFRRFTLGIAPLAGVDGRRLAPTWARGAAFLFRHGKMLYGFEGLRSYKAKFATRWEPRYIAGPRGMAFAQGMAAVHRIVSRPPATKKAAAPVAAPA